MEAIPGDGRADPEGSAGAPGSDGRSIRILFLGTSLTEGLGLEVPGTEAWPARVEALARAEGFPVEARNAGLSGETSAGALRRVEWVLDPAWPPHVVVVEAGANDGLRGLSVEALERNLTALVQRIGDRLPDARLVLVGMEAPPNLGPAYVEAFRTVYPTVAGRFGARLVPFLLEGVAGVPGFNQADGIHPTAEGHARMAEVAWPVIREAVASLEARR